MYTVKVYNKMNNVAKEIKEDAKTLALQKAKMLSYWHSWTKVEDENFKQIAVYEKGKLPF